VLHAAEQCICSCCVHATEQISASAAAGATVEDRLPLPPAAYRPSSLPSSCIVSEVELSQASASAFEFLAGAAMHCVVASAEPAEGSKVQKVVFATVRPADYSLPYSTLEKNNVAFSAVDKRSNKLLTIMVSELPAAVVPVAAGSAASAAACCSSQCCGQLVWHEHFSVQ